MVTIQIDDDVQRALADKAIEEGFDLFSPATPNLVLRTVLGLDQSPKRDWTPDPPKFDSADSHDSPTGVDTSSHAPSRTHHRIGPRLLREHELPCVKGYFSKTGIPFQKPDRFPAAFFDNHGYVVVDDEASMRSNPYINVGKQVSIPKGVHSIPGYVKCGHNHS